MTKTPKINKEKPTKKCSECKRVLSLINFYNNNNPMSDGKSPLCKKCINEMIDYSDIKTVHSALRAMDLPFLIDLWEDSSNRIGKTFGNYLRQINSLPNYRGMTWEDSVFEKKSIENSEISVSAPTQPAVVVTPDLIEKWGNYPPDEIILFEKKYQQLKVNYPERTAMHIEALQIYVRYRVKEELATQKGQSKEAESWGKLAKDAAVAAKINPSQLSKSDLSDGLDSFSQLTRNVEQAIDVIEILPQFKERPQDKVDFTIWCYVNYVRDLKGLPPAEYKDIFAFYDQRKKEYESNIDGEDNVFL
ncbi:hypothetical protein [Paenibacillus sp. XY044]|uniref:hypothetical protein n=1 Tax=Paenibacillus sp. XY044 TaxID=2026089 RepID=UPI000B991F8B|nr:hypothetical protein [Paenibacillus sp. XY044]OZB98032.1 hypothetical protein CJP46_02375 [Paenibacillus sp. XY044]